MDSGLDAILKRVKDEGVLFGSGPRSRTDGEINHLHQGREFYFECENGHVWGYYAHVCLRRDGEAPKRLGVGLFKGRRAYFIPVIVRQ